MVSEEDQKAWSMWKPSNRFGILADSDISHNSEDSTTSPLNSSTPTNSPPPSPSSQAGSVLITPTHNNSIPSDDDSNDSAVHSGEEEKNIPQLESCPFCPTQEGEDLPATIRQHIIDTHILAIPQPPTPSPTKISSNIAEEPRCSISGKATADCIS